MVTQSNKEQLHAPYEWYRTMRATQPVFNNPEWGGWQVFRYADVARVLNEYATFSSDGHRMAQSGLAGLHAAHGGATGAAHHHHHQRTAGPRCRRGRDGRGARPGLSAPRDR